MHLQPANLYHIYNRSNNKELLFSNREDYLFFLRKIRSYLIPHCDILNYCLMPTHFHFLLYLEQDVNIDLFRNAVGVLLRSYTQAINKQNGRTGSLFQLHTKAKEVSEYEFICFNYIHQNPFVGKQVKKMEDWEFSSFRDYLGLRDGTLCNKTLAEELLGIEWRVENFYKLSYRDIPEEKIKSLYVDKTVYC